MRDEHRDGHAVAVAIVIRSPSRARSRRRERWVFASWMLKVVGHRDVD